MELLFSYFDTEWEHVSANPGLCILHNCFTDENKYTHRDLGSNINSLRNMAITPKTFCNVGWIEAGDTRLVIY